MKKGSELLPSGRGAWPTGRGWGRWCTPRTACRAGSRRSHCLRGSERRKGHRYRAPPPKTQQGGPFEKNAGPRTLIYGRDVVHLLIGRREVPGVVGGGVGPHALRTSASHREGQSEEDQAHRRRVACQNAKHLALCSECDWPCIHAEPTTCARVQHAAKGTGIHASATCPRMKNSGDCAI